MVTLWIQKVPLILLGSWVEQNDKDENVAPFWAEPSIGACHSKHSKHVYMQLLTHSTIYSIYRLLSVYICS